MNSPKQTKEQLLDPQLTQNENEPLEYTVNINSKIQQLRERHQKNEICTSKYTTFNCVPKILYEQFSKVGNFYFLFLMILELIPGITNTEGYPVILIPLLFVVTVNGIKDFYEDYQRKNSDSKENKTISEVLNIETGLFEKVEWKDLKPGNIVKVNSNENFPADCLVFYSCNKKGNIFIETKSLDGETNLKHKESVNKIYKKLCYLNSDEERLQIVRNMCGKIVCDQPNPQMYKWEGNYFYENKLDINVINNDGDDIKTDDLLSSNVERSESFESSHSELTVNNNNSSVYDLSYSNFILRGSVLKNTDHVFAVVVYCGHYSKIMLNSLTARNKLSKLFKMMNGQLIFVIFLQIIICIFCAFVYCLSDDPYEGVLYKNEDYGPFVAISNFIISFFSWFLAISNILPISLLVTLDMIKYCQAMFIMWDFKLYNHSLKKTAVVQSSSLNEELGQVHHIFSDKTGTLTKNIMNFKFMSIDNVIYGSDDGMSDEEKRRNKITNVDFRDEKFFEIFKDKKHPNHKILRNYVFDLAICHSIIAEVKDSELIYNASSPDELALVNAARYFGVEFFDRNEKNEIFIKFDNDVYKYEVLHTMEFNSDRKRMSVLFKDEHGRIKIVCKGADTMIAKLLKSNVNLSPTLQNLESFGKKGLRTLLIGERYVHNDEYAKFIKIYNEALISTEKAIEIEKAYELLENNFDLVGATAIEDCLQDDLSN